MLFEYKAVKNNKVIKKRIESESEGMILNYLRTNGYFPIEIHEVKALGSGVNLPFLKPINFAEIVDFTRQLAIMLNAGLTVVDALGILKKQSGNKNMTTLVDEIDKKIKGGESLYSALRDYPQYFPNLYIALIKAGEASGKLSEIMLKLSENLEKEREFRGRLRGALLYPAVVVVAMIVVSFIMLTFVIPKLLTLYQDFNVELPLTTRILIGVSSFCATFWPLIVGVAGLATFAVYRYLQTRVGKQMKDAMLLKMPVFSKIIVMSALVDATRTLAILISSGVSILDSLTIVTDTTTNSIYQEAFKNVYGKVEKGASLGKALADEGVFPPILIQMTQVGENTGNLDDTLKRLAHYFETESDLNIKAATTLIEPAVLVVLGLAVGFLVFSIITPIYSLTNAIQ